MTEKDGADPKSPKIEPLGKKHDRVVFSCGNDALDTYLKKRASQDAKKKIAKIGIIKNHSSIENLYFFLSFHNKITEANKNKVIAIGTLIKKARR